jgi:D-alanyl-D-alanine carboxypeptidase (penicillin-binding protein 5/6)
MGLAKGDRVDLEGLLHGLLMSSGNDAANVLAEATSGSVPAFMEELNAYVRKIGCVDTSFLNPHGYHHPEHISTAYELSLLTKKALEIPKFREIIGKQVYRTAQKPDVELRQRNKLMKPGEHYYPKAIGGKTGFHSMAQNNLVAAATDQDRTLIAVVLGCPKSDDRYRDAKALFEAAFAEEKIESLLVSKEQVYTKNIEGAKRPLTASVATPLAISFYPAETPKVKGFVYWDELSLPVRMGQKVGEIKVVDEQGTELGRQELFSQGSVDPTFFFSLKRCWKRLFGSILVTRDLLVEL